MFIQIHIDGVETPICIPIEKAGKTAQHLEKSGKSFRLGKTLD